MTWRDCPFEEGRFYRVKRNFKLLSFDFKSGDRIVFKNQKYNRYDSSTIYNFRNERTGEDMQWWLHDDMPIESWKDYFE